MATKTIKCHICVICSRTYKRKYQLISHIRIHTGERPYKCETCGSSFTSSGGLQSHVRTHTGEKPYKCTICGKTFSWKSTFNRHLKTHSNAKAHICVFCGRGFVDSEDLYRHIRSHIGEKPYPCDVCSKEYSRSRYLAEHSRTASHQKKLNSGGGVSHDANASFTPPPVLLDTVIAEKKERLQVVNQEIQAQQANVRRFIAMINSHEAESKSLENEIEQLETSKAKGKRFLND
ncbi:unnamed protein product [Orchesella dallaii]|uniref:C2H2-type domain-containing protein n=1 Tax=Orchesella dallaii TaxID=48710 RepID=A0ABP1RPA5_9HEXA